MLALQNEIPAAQSAFSDLQALFQQLGELKIQKISEVTQERQGHKIGAFLVQLVRDGKLFFFVLMLSALTLSIISKSILPPFVGAIAVPVS